MDKFNLGHMISRFVRYQVNINPPKQANVQPSPPQNPAPSMKQDFKPSAFTSTGSVSTNAFDGGDKSVYIKDLMKLPRNMNELMFMLQKNLTQMQMNRMFEQQIAARRNLLSGTQAQILAQLQGFETSEMQAALKGQMNNQLASSLKNLQIAGSQMINIADIAALIQTNGKDAVTKLILAMANAAKQGTSDLTGLKESAKLINASIALASTDNPAQTLKTLMLLYLPWLPLHEGADFDLEVEAFDGGAENDSILVVTITTVHWGVAVATLILENSNAVHINIECSEEFPKDELLLRIEGEQKHYSMESVISFETKKVSEDIQKPEITNAKINMSHTNEISPYLLLAAHALIRHTIDLDRENI